MMRIYGAGNFDNERADLSGKAYVNLCFEKIERSLAFLETDDSCQTLLAELDVLLMLAQKFTDDVFVKLKKSQLKQWEKQYFAWYDRSQKKIPAKYRTQNKKNAEKLFTQLDEFANDIAWL